MKHIQPFVVVAAVMALAWVMVPAHALETDWSAQWIAPQDECKPNSWQSYRRQFTLEQAPQNAQVRIACDSKYWLWVNGELVVFEGQVKRGPTPNDTYYDIIDLTPHLQAGDNTVAALVWYWGRSGYSHRSSGKAAFLFEADIDGSPLLSDSQWKAIVHPAYGSTGEPHPNRRLSEHNIRFDARKDIGNWQAPGFDDSDWQPARTFGTPPVAPWNQLYYRMIPQWKDFGMTDYVEISEQQNQDGHTVFICKLPYNAHVTPYLKVRAPAGKLIDIRTDNYMGGSAANVRAEYITREGQQEYESLGWMNGHDVRYTVPAGVEVLALKFRETGYGSEVLGTMVTDDADMNTLWDKAFRTLYVNMRDTYMDCPDRERAQWWGDVVNQLGQAFFVFDPETGPPLAQKGIYELARWQRADGSLFSPIPITAEVERELPMQMLASVGWYGFWTYYWYSGDQQTIADVYPAVRDYLALWRIGDNGLTIRRRGGWDWADWGDNQDREVLANAWLYLALRGAVEMAALTGHDDDIEGYRQKLQSIENAFNETFWQGSYYRDPGHQGSTDDRANALAVVAGLAKPEYYPAIKELLATEYHASPYMEKYVLEALYMMDAPTQAIERTKKRYAAMIASPLTTLWEGWGIGREGFGGGSYNHGWSGGPMTMLNQYAAGIAPTEPAFKTFAVMPQMGPLNMIKTTVPTQFGMIALELRQKEDAFEMELTVPEDTSAQVGIPQSEAGIREVQINQTVVYKDSEPVAHNQAVAFEGRDERRVRFTLPPGTWTISAE